MSDFRPYPVFLETSSNDTYDVILKLWIKSEQDEVKLRQLKPNWRTTVTKSAPLQLGRLPHGTGAKAAPVVSPTGARLSFREVSDRPLRFKWRASEGEKVKLETELSELRELISETAMTLDGYDRLLKPYWDKKGDVEDAVRRTHGRGYANVLVFNPDRAADRKPLFDDLMALAIEWGPTKAERSVVQTRIGGYERQAKTIETELKRLAKKGKKHG